MAIVEIFKLNSIENTFGDKCFDYVIASELIEFL